jgi:Xaa-Pro aminopeptidase
MTKPSIINTIISEGTIGRISDAELERRWQAVTARMKEQDVAVLLVRASNDYLGGYVKWFCGIPASTGYPVTLLFDQQANISYISQGFFGLDRKLDSPDPVYRGVQRILGAPGYASVDYSANYEAEAVAKALAGLRGRRMGVIGAANLPYALADRLRTDPAICLELVDFSSEVDAIKCLKSAEELRQIEQAAEMQDACMEAVAEQARPGLKDIEISAIAQGVALQHGSEQGVYLVGSAPIGTARPFGIRHFQGRTLQRGDYFNILVENNGPGGFYTELGRMFVLGQASDEMRSEVAFVSQAQDWMTARLRPGAKPATLWDEYNAYMRENGRPEERRLFCHGQGYDLVERPLVRNDESMPLSAGMSIACHPTVASATLFCSSCDNYLIEENQTRRLHRFPRGLVELD